MTAKQTQLTESKGFINPKELRTKVEKKIKKINVLDLVKQSMIQMKMEEIGSWLATHRTPLFYAHKNGFTVVDQKFIEENKWLKRSLSKLLKVLEDKKNKTIHPAPPKNNTNDAEYIG